MSEKMRAEFELWLNDNNQLALKEDDGEYSFQHTRLAWQAWQASRASLVVELPEKAALMSASSVYSALDGAGVSYK